jgi:branched-subunit amino acid aminotransferase/4-amino-4-deoxychorismate lyase
MTGPLAYLNGRFLPFAEAALPLHDAGVVSGATVVDNARTFRHKLFRWADHLARFRRDCAACFVPLDASDGHLTATAEELVARNAQLLPTGGELQVVTFATPGPLGFYLGEADNGPPTLGMATYPLPFARYRRFFTEGVTLAVVGHQPADPGAVVPPGVKHRSRMAWWVAERRAKQSPHPPGAVALLTDAANGTIAETAIANFLCVLDGCVTIPPSDRVLAGISLRETVALCRDSGLPVRERPIPVSDVPRMSEALLTGTGFCLAGVRRIDGYSLTWPGPVFRTLLAAWTDRVGVDVARQFTETGG